MTTGATLPPPVTNAPSAPPPPAQPPARLWQRLWRRPFFKRAFYEALGIALWRSDGFEMLNCGYHDASEPRLILPPAYEKNRFGCQLYDRLVRATPLRGLDVLEIGCGRGAGARFLADHFQPRTMVATDAARTLAWAAQRAARRAGTENLRYLRAPASRLPFRDGSFAIAISVEATHPLADKSVFLSEAARVLAADGRLLVVDFFYARVTSVNAAERFRAAVAASRFQIEVEEDWTKGAADALEAQSPRRLEAIARLPRWLRGPVLSFAGTTESPLYRQLCDGSATYRHFALRKSS